MRKYSPQYCLEALGIDQHDTVARMISAIVWGAAIDGRPCYSHAAEIGRKYHISERAVWSLVEYTIHEALDTAQDIDPYVEKLFRGKTVRGALIWMAEQIRDGG